MFTLTAIPVKFICLLVLFCWSTLWEGRQFWLARGAARTSHGFHLLMAVVMLAMVPRSLWRPLAQVVPVWLVTAAMAMGVVWFAWRAVRAPAGHRWHPVGCMIMFAAMVWHLVAMEIAMRSMAMGHGSSASTPSGTHTMAGMDHASMSPTAATSHPGSMGGMDHAATTGHPAGWWVAVVGVPLMAWLLWAGLTALVRALRHRSDRASALADFAMNFGMFWMSTGLLVPLIPAFAHLSF